MPWLFFGILLSGNCFAQYYGGGGAGEHAFSLERWDEDYSYLKDAKAGGDFLDPIKYMPLNKQGDVYLSLGGQARYRYDYFNNPTFGPGTNDEDGFHLQRYLLHADLHAGQYVRAFVQADSAWVDGREGGPRPGDTDHLDLQQGFVDLKTSDAANPFGFLRLGRQELVYGAQRLVSPDDWRNVRRSFDGAKLSLSIPNDTVEAFWVRPVLIEQDQFNNDVKGTSFAGIYNVLALPALMRDGNLKLDTYLFALNQSRRSPAGIDADTYTAGMRFHGNPKPFDFDVEGDYQFGQRGGQGGANISAWSVAAEAGYTLPTTMTPRAFAGLDIASGSPDVGKRFNQLFPPTYMYLGHVYLFGRTNLIDTHAGVELHLTHNLTFSAAEHVFWRENTDDAMYNLSGAVVRADNGTDAAYVGNELDFSLNWQIGEHLTGYIGWAHFFTGDFIQNTGASEDVDFLYVSATFTF
ncbi:MAG TPA: alginate export family protein [Tepidisphaeraceae bacterium]